MILRDLVGSRFLPIHLWKVPTKLGDFRLDFDENVLFEIYSPVTLKPQCIKKGRFCIFFQYQLLQRGSTLYSFQIC